MRRRSSILFVAGWTGALIVAEFDFSVWLRVPAVVAVAFAAIVIGNVIANRWATSEAETPTDTTGNGSPSVSRATVPTTNKGHRHD